MSGSSSRTPPRPWYREPWPWVAIAIPAIAVIGGLVTFYLAVSHPDPIVVDDSRYRAIDAELRAQDPSEPAAAKRPGEQDAGDGDR